MHFTVALIQMSAGADKAENLSVASGLIREAARQGARVVALPEVFNFVGDASLWSANAESLDGPTASLLGSLARELGLYLLGGSIMEKSSEPDRVSNTSLFFGPTGSVLAVYRKMHLFDVTLPDGVIFSEVDHTVPGGEIVSAPTPLGRFGLSICYDLRFPELYRALMLQSVDFVFAPSAFTAFTGQYHWEVLIRARAIENQVFMLAPNQVGKSATGVDFYGRSLIVDPWGEVLARGGSSTEIVFSELDTDVIHNARQRIASLSHVRPDLLRKLSEGH